MLLEGGGARRLRWLRLCVCWDMFLLAWGDVLAGHKGAGDFVGFGVAVAVLALSAMGATDIQCGGAGSSRGGQHGPGVWVWGWLGQLCSLCRLCQLCPLHHVVSFYRFSGHFCTVIVGLHDF